MREAHYISHFEASSATVVFRNEHEVAEAVEGGEHGDAVAAIVFEEVVVFDVPEKHEGDGVGGGLGGGWRVLA